ncbi:HAD family hydrolase [Psychromonas aquatilis]|uniref:HAD hydrolase-like protein n=1 Tax=Psychromonas aquatilis TaxID=2005072 RepID=A0ABU9GP30_9GAMM
MNSNIFNKKPQSQVYLFDWGDTLMVDFPDYSGKMYQWPKIQVLANAEIMLATLAKTATIFVATGAADSTEQEIKLAFERANLNQYISGYFCKENLGVDKKSLAFFPRIIEKLNVPASQIVMVGDYYQNDIQPAIIAGITAIWLTSKDNISTANEFKTITDLSELIS